jgi:hypothetical protein
VTRKPHPLSDATSSTLVGVGAPHPPVPAGCGLARWALAASFRKLAGVANALGAVAGNVAAVCAATIRPAGEGFQVFGADAFETAEFLEDATRIARQFAEREARAEAFRRGASGELVIRFEEKPLVSTTGYGGEVFIESTVTATAIGKIGL